MVSIFAGEYSFFGAGLKGSFCVELARRKGDHGDLLRAQEGESLISVPFVLSVRTITGLARSKGAHGDFYIYAPERED